jgi:NCAIR mutase (PurE)-related protein
MDPSELHKLLSAIRSRELSVDEGLARLATLPFEDVGDALIDNHRGLRQGASEVVFGQSKTTDQILRIADGLLNGGNNVLITRLDADKAMALSAQWPEAEYDPLGKTLTIVRKPLTPRGRGTILVVCAGTSDLPVAREAATAARMLGNEVEELSDVGVAGLHRLLAHLDRLRRASVIIAVAGMEGALPSVIGGLVAAPVIAVPTSVGYGAALGGVAALLGMLNSCASGITVVNIDNGFGAASAAARINRREQP